MKQMSRHQLLLAIAGLGFLAFAAAHFLVIRPIAADVKKLRQTVDTTSTELRARGWPLDVERLEVFARTKAKERDIAARLKGQVIAKTSGGFMDKIAPLYEDRESFQRRATRLDYQEEFQRVIRKLEGRGVLINKEILDLSETSMAPQTYQLILHLWALEAIIDRVLAHELAPMTIEHTPLSATGQPLTPVKGAAISIADPQAYLLSADAPGPYLLEFPVRLRVQGTIDKLHGFLQAAPSGDRFLTVTGLEVTKPLPGRHQQQELLEINLECSCFYLMAGENAVPLLQSKPKVLPAGA